MSLNPLNHHYAMENLASIYDEEAMTALELAGRTTAKVNETVEAFNALKTNTENHLGAQDESIQKMNNVTMPAKVTAEVQRKIDSGEFDQAIDQYAGNLDARLDNLVGKVVEGTTTMDAEIIDSRLGADNVIYASMGKANREQFKTKANAQAVQATLYIPPAGTEYALSWSNDSGTLRVFCPENIVLSYDNQHQGGLDWATCGGDIPEVIQPLSDKVWQAHIVLSAHGQKLVYNVTEHKYKSRTRYEHEPDDIVILVNHWGNPGGGLLMKYIALDRSIDMLSAGHTAIYIGAAGSDSPVTWYREGTSDNLIFNIPGTIQFRGLDLSAEKIPWSAVGESVGDSLTVNEDGGATVKLSGYGFRFVFNTRDQLYHIRGRNSLNRFDIVLMINGYGTPAGGELMRYVMMDRITQIEGKLVGIGGLTDDVREKVKSFSAQFKNTNKVESFLFFTDPHLCQFTGDNWRTEFNQYMGTLSACASEAPVSRVFCGGDWLGHGETKDEACYRLGLIDSTMRKTLPEYHLICGNHDTNYQGREDAASEMYTGQMDINTINNLWYRKTGKAYYTVEGENTHFFVFDTDAEVGVLNDYMREQCKWFGEQLQANTCENIVIMVHIAYKTDGTMEPITEKLLDIAAKFNSRLTATYDGTAFDFTKATGKIRLCMAGHNHCDAIDSSDAGIPIVRTTHMRDGNKPTFDLCLLNYDEGVAKFYRVGTGADRTCAI